MCAPSGAAAAWLRRCARPAIKATNRSRCSKRRLALCYRDAFAGPPEVRLLQEPPSCERNDWLQTLMHKLPPYQQRPRGALAGGGIAGTAHH
ncbi:hypothetical protein CKO42_26170 [Lamprobacter modestohalophilus]|uniref:Uncharacterized protein n=1 Tax=Lamprobacter modestohalophilus TaxID=1064514 RepID=A0A9X0WE21_9GAMM|nr:hypothetical protein [Lamprobacter modestohalophilus]MBK1621803.1 hypothetical protein [Lamprobacter modestohalophilus]